MQQDIKLFLKHYGRPAQPFFSASIAAGFLSGLFLLVQAWCLMKIINGAVFEGETLGSFSLYFVLLLCIFMARFFLSFLSSRFSFLGAQRVKQTLRTQLYKRMQELGPSFINRVGTGALLNAFAEGVEALEGYYARYIPAAALMVFLPFSILICVFPIDWVSGVVMFVTAPLIPLFMILIGKGAEVLNQKQWETLSRMSNRFLDALRGLTTLKLFNAARHEGEMIAKVSNDYKQGTMKVLRIAFLSSVTLEFFSTVSIAVVAVLIGFRLLWGEMDFAHGFFILLLAPEFYLPLRSMGAAYHSRMEAVGALDGIMEVMFGDVPDVRGKIVDLSSVHIEFDDVYVSYDGGRSGLNGVSFEIPHGQKIALIGPSGSGKSTIMALLLGFIKPSKGRILINGVDLQDIDVDHWREQIGWVPQHPTLFYGSVLDNLHLGNQGARDDAIYTVCHKLGVDDFINELPQGYETRVGENGFGLSGGQVQRLAIARAFLRRQSPLFLMDEPTASLDRQTEIILQRAMELLSENRSALTIAHRLHTVRGADEILYLEEGKIVAQGNHKSLLKKHSEYARLIAHEILDIKIQNGEVCYG